MNIIAARQQERSVKLGRIENLLKRCMKAKKKIDHKRLVLTVMDECRCSNRTAKEYIELVMYRLNTTIIEVCLPTCQMQTMLKGGKKNTAS